MAASRDLLDVDPPELQFPCKLPAPIGSQPSVTALLSSQIISDFSSSNFQLILSRLVVIAVVLYKQISCPLRLTNRTDSTVAFKVVHG